VEIGHEVVVLDDLSTGSKVPIAGAYCTRGSVLDCNHVIAAAAGVDLVIHLASVVGKLLAAEQPNRSFETAVQGTMNVFIATPATCPVVLFSSSAVYGVDALGPVRELRDVSEQRAYDYDGGKKGYAVGKLHMEGLGAYEAAFGRPVLTVRPFNVVGPGQVGRYGMVLPRLIRNARYVEPLVVYGDGTQTRSFSHINKFVNVMLRLIEREEAWQLRHPINVGAPEATSITSLAETVLMTVGSRAPIQYVPYESVFPGQRDVIERIPDTEVLDKLIGATQWPSVTEIVRDTYNATV